MLYGKDRKMWWQLLVHPELTYCKVIVYVLTWPEIR
jgi:hypothetical protein